MRKALRSQAILACILFLSLSVFAQGPGYIIRQAGTTNLGSGGTTGAFPSAATVTGKEILNPDNASSTNQNNYATKTPYTGVWTTTDDVTGSEIAYAAIPPYSSEPFADLRRGPSHLYSDFVPSGRASDLGASYYMYYNSTAGKEALCFRLRLGSIIPGAKGYSILIDADGKAGATGPNADPNYVAATTGVNGNPGFELEVDLFTQNSGTGIALYNVDGTSSPVLVWSASDYTQFSQVSFAGTNDNGDPDFYLDFFIPWNKITGITSLGITTSTNLRFIPTTVMSPQAAIGGPKSDIYGLNDNLYPDANLEYETLLSAMPGFSMTQLSSTAAGSVPNSGNTQLCTAAPTISNVTTTGGTFSKGVVTGTWSKLSISPETNATITLYLNGAPMAGTVTATSGSTWTYNIPAAVTLVASDKITAQAKANNENMCQVSNTYRITSCPNATWVASNLVAPLGDNSATDYSCFIGTAPTTTKGIGGTNRTNANWTVFVNEAFANTTKNSTTDQGTGAFSNGGNTTFTPTTVSSWLFSNGCQKGSPLASGTYAFWYQDANGCKSEITPVCVGLAGKIMTPTVSPSSVSNTTTTVTVTGAIGSDISLYYDGQVIASGTIPGTFSNTTSGSITFTGLSFEMGGNVYAMANHIVSGNATSSYCMVKSIAQTVVMCTTSAPAITIASSTGLLTAGAIITGTGQVGTTLRLYNSSNTLLATTTVGTDGRWTTSGATFSGGFTGTAVAGVIYYATAQSTTCNVSANSVSITTASGVTAGRCGSITGTVTSATTAISGTLTGTPVTGTVVNLYEDGYLIGSTTTGTSGWGPIDVTNKLYSGNGTTSGKLTIGVQEPGKEELACPSSAATVTCTGPLTPAYTQASSNGTTGTNATVPSGGTMTYTITNLAPSTFYSVADATTGQSYASGVWTSTSTPASISITTNPLTVAGNYNGIIKATSVTATEMCSSLAMASTFKVLPVTFIEFKGVRTNTANVLTWKTGVESGTVRFDIQQSADGANFVTIGSQTASGNNSSYTFTDQNPASAASYYRLKVIDADGKASYSKIILLKENGASMVLASVRPNPFVQDITVTLTLGAPQKLTLSLVDAAGRTVATRQTAGAQGLNTIVFDGLGKISKGLYVLQVHCADGLLQEKVIKNH